MTTTTITMADSMGRNTTAQNLTTYSGRLGANVRARREQRKISVAKFAVALKVRPVTIYAWESGSNPIPVNSLPALAKALGTTVKKLLPEA